MQASGRRVSGARGQRADPVPKELGALFVDDMGAEWWHLVGVAPAHAKPQNGAIRVARANDRGARNAQVAVHRLLADPELGEGRSSSEVEIGP